MCYLQSFDFRRGTRRFSTDDCLTLGLSLNDKFLVELEELGRYGDMAELGSVSERPRLVG